MTTLLHHVQPRSDGQVLARAQWRARVLLVGGGFQVAFGAWWLVRALRDFTSLPVALVAGGVVVVAAIPVTSSLLASAPRPHGPHARRLERRLSIATLVQLGASLLVPWGLDHLDGRRLSLAVVMASIGVLLLWIHREVDAPYQASAGTILIALSLVSAALSGSAQTVFAGLSSAVVLLGCASAGYHWLEHHDLTD